METVLADVAGPNPPLLSHVFSVRRAADRVVPSKPARDLALAEKHSGSRLRRRSRKLECTDRRLCYDFLNLRVGSRLCLVPSSAKQLFPPVVFAQKCENGRRERQRFPSAVENRKFVQASARRERLLGTPGAVRGGQCIIPITFQKFALFFELWTVRSRVFQRGERFPHEQ